MDLQKTLEKINEERERVEAAFVFCLWKNPELFDDYKEINVDKGCQLESKDASFYFNLGRALKNHGYNVFDNITVNAFIADKPEIKKRFESYGGWHEVEQLESLVNPDNVSSYYDEIAKRNSLSIICKKYDEVFSNVDRFKNASNEDIYETFDLLNNSVSLSTNREAKIETLEITEQDINDFNSGEAVGLNYSKAAPLLNYTTLGLPIGDIYMLAGHSGCVDAETEFFNGCQWKSIAEYRNGEKVLQWNPDGTANLITPLQYIKKPCDKMYHFENQHGLNQTLSAEHRVVYLDHNAKLCEMQMQDLNKLDNFDGQFITSFKYNVDEIVTTNELNKILSLAEYTDDGTQGYGRLPQWYNLTQQQLRLVCIEALTKCTVYDSLKIFSTIDKELADFIQFVFTACGYTAVIKKEEKYKVLISDADTIRFDNDTQITQCIPINGMKYCFSVPSSYLVLRRHGSIFITGNCGKSSFAFNIAIALSQAGNPVCILSNEMQIKAYKNMLLSYVLTAELNYWKLTRKKIKIGGWTEEEMAEVRRAAAIIKEKYNNIYFVKLFDNNGDLVMKHMKRINRNNGVKAFIWDTYKGDDTANDKMWQELLMSSRKVFNLVAKEQWSLICTFQLALYTTNQRYLDAGCLSSSKQIKEVVSELIMMRKLWQDEYTGQKYDCHPFRFNKDNKKIKEEITLDPEKIYVVAIVDKTRNDENAKNIIYQWDSTWNRWYELGYCTITNDHRGVG